MQFCLAEFLLSWRSNPEDVVELPVKRTMASLAVPRYYLREGRGRAEVIMCCRYRSRALSNNRSDHATASNILPAERKLNTIIESVRVSPIAGGMKEWGTGYWWSMIKGRRLLEELFKKGYEVNVAVDGRDSIEGEGQYP